MQTIRSEQVSSDLFLVLRSVLHEGILVADDRKIITQANDAALKIPGLPPQTSAGRHISEVRTRCPGAK